MNEQAGKWSFLTSHARVLIVVAHDPATRLGDIAAACHITERTAQNIVHGLERTGYMRRERSGRRSRHILCMDGTLRHPAEAHVPVRDSWNSSPLTPASAEASARPWRTAGAVSTAHHWCVSVSRGPYDKHSSLHARPRVEKGFSSSGIV
ncbi:hypothetical protein ACFTY8_29760 [Streptomyces mirabilis]|uniref:hypothetical protein n=1 Tax=Streptomyces mirabilis TaxID=68239 RepID=UPI0036438234